MAAIHRQNSAVTPSAFRLQHSSPLDTLVRRTSSRRVANAGSSRTTRQAETPEPVYAPPPQQYVEDLRPYSTADSDTYPGDYIYDEPGADEDIGSALDNLSHSSTPQKTTHNFQRPPSSPLLHTEFRNSSATADDGASYMDPNRSSVATTALFGGRPFQANGYNDAERQYQTNSYYDDSSVYSRDSSAWPQPPMPGQGDHYPDDHRSHMGDSRDSWREGDNVPTVVVSSHVESRQPVVGRQQSSNYSRPVRAVYDAPASSLPLLASDQRKLDVLQRNASRVASPLNSPSNRSPSFQSNRALSPSPSSSSSNRAPSPASTILPQRNYEPVGPAPQPRSKPGRQPDPMSGSTSPVVPYSSYSFYQLEPSPTGTTFLSPGGSGPRTPTPHTPQSARPKTPTGPSYDPLKDPRTVNDYLQLGIKHHEANRLQESAACFEKSAKGIGPGGRPAPPRSPKSSALPGEEDMMGSGVGMLMWGLTLRHGWGCEKNEKMGFKWLTKAAENAVGDLEATRGGMDANAVKTELVLAIYEVGQCFFQGWGVPQDKKMAVSYYGVAARLGDPDAQHDLAFCLANGKGCKKDKKAAAKWYRAAVAQGTSDIGLAWIFKEKYQ